MGITLLSVFASYRLPQRCSSAVLRFFWFSGPPTSPLNTREVCPLSEVAPYFGRYLSVVCSISDVCSSMVDTAPVDTQTARRVGTRGSGGPPNLQKVKLTGSFEIDSVITTEAVFWIRVMTSGSNFGNNYSGGGGRGVFRCQHHCNADCL